MGYLRVRRSIKLGSGVKLNLSKRSLGLTVGARGAHYSVNNRGQRTATIGLPGTGVSYVDRSSRRHSVDSDASRAVAPFEDLPHAVDPAPPAPHPGLLARHYERAFYRGLQKLHTGDPKAALADFVDADQSDDKHRAISPALLAGILAHQLGDPTVAVPYLERVTKSSLPLPDELMNKYASGLAIRLGLNELLATTIEVGSAAASMVLAECYRETKRLQEAIGLMQQLHDHVSDSTILMILCTLYREAEEWDELVHATAGITNEDDITLMLRLLQAEAMEKQQIPDAAMEAYRDALKSRKRDAELLKRARYGRARLCLSSGKRAMAKRDLGQLYGEDPDYKDVAALLRDLA